MPSMRRDADKTRYELPDYGRAPSPSPPAKRGDAEARRERFFQVSAVDFVALPVSGRGAAQPAVLGPLEGEARPPSYNVGGERAIRAEELSRRCASEEPCGSALWAKEPFLIQDTTHADKVTRIVASAAFLSKTDDKRISRNDGNRQCSKKDENYHESNHNEMVNVNRADQKHRRPRRTSTGKPASAPPSRLRARSGGTAPRSIAAVSSEGQAQQQSTLHGTSSGKRESVPPSGFRFLSHGNQQVSEFSPAVKGVNRKSLPVPIVPAFVPKEVFLDFSMSKTEEEATKPPCDLFGPRRLSNSLYDLDAWSDAVDTIGTETWADMARGTGPDGVSVGNQERPKGQGDSHMHAPGHTTVKSPASPSRNDGNCQDDGIRPDPDAMSALNAVAPEDIASPEATGMCSGNALSAGNYSDCLRGSEVFSENKNLPSLLKAKESIVIGGPSRAGSTSESSVDLDLRYQDVEDDILRRSAVEIDTSQHVKIPSAEIALTSNDSAMLTNKTVQASQQKGETARFIMGGTKSPSSTGSRVAADPRPMGPRLLYLVPPGADNERRSEGDNMICGSQRIMPYSPTTDAEDEKRSPSTASSSSSGRRLFGLATHRMSDESDEVLSLPSSSFYADDEYDRFCQRDDSPLRRKRNSYLSRILAGEVRERAQSRNSNGGSSQSRNSNGGSPQPRHSNAGNASS